MSGIMIRDDARALELAAARGVVVPPMFEEVREATGTTFRRMFMGWRVSEGEKDRGYVILIPSVDGEDWEIMADGGWSIREARRLFRWIFGEAGMKRVSARCKSTNLKNIRVLESMGFVREGLKRLSDCDVISFGMFREECRFLKEA